MEDVDNVDNDDDDDDDICDGVIFDKFVNYVIIVMLQLRGYIFCNNCNDCEYIIE